MTILGLNTQQPVFTSTSTSKSWLAMPTARSHEEPQFTVEDRPGAEMSDVERLRCFAKTGQMPAEPAKKHGLAPGEGTQIATDASAPRETDSELAAEVRNQYRESLDKAQKARNEGLDYLYDLGAGKHILEDGTRVTVRTGKDGKARVDLTSHDGDRSRIDFNTENPDFVRQSGPDGKKVRQNGQRVSVDGTGAFKTTRKGNVVRSKTVGTDGTGTAIVETTTVKPNGKARKVTSSNR